MLPFLNVGCPGAGAFVNEQRGSWQCLYLLGGVIKMTLQLCRARQHRREKWNPPRSHLGNVEIFQNKMKAERSYFNLTKKLNSLGEVARLHRP